MSDLTFRYDHDPSFFDKNASRDDFGKLTLSVTTERFSGRGSFWVQWQDVTDFGNSLSTFPIRPEAPWEPGGASSMGRVTTSP